MQTLTIHPRGSAARPEKKLNSLTTASLCDYHSEMKPVSWEACYKETDWRLPGKWWRALLWARTWFCLEITLRTITYSRQYSTRACRCRIAVSCGEGKLLMFLLAVSLPFSFLVPFLGVWKYRWGWSDLGCHWSAQQNMCTMSKNVYIQWDLKYLKQNTWEEVLLGIAISWTVQLPFLGKARSFSFPGMHKDPQIQRHSVPNFTCLIFSKGRHGALGLTCDY